MIHEPYTAGVPEEPPSMPAEHALPPLRAFYLYLTSGCNLRCRHCWISPGHVKDQPEPGTFLELEQLKSAVAEAKPLGLQSAKLTGGEPLIHPQFREIATFLASENIRVDMETNGTRIDRETAFFIKEQTNIWFISVSLDSTDPDVHDRFRGVKGAHAAAVKGVQNLVEAGYRPQIIMSPHRKTLHDIDRMVELATQLGAGSVKFNPVSRAGRGEKMHQSGEALDYREYRELIQYIYGPLLERSRIGLAISSPMALLPVKDLLRGHWRGFCNIGNIMGILGTGHIALCGIGRHVPELCYGKLGKDSLQDVWKHTPLLNEIRRQLRSPFPDICGDCIHAPLCRTGCPAMNYMNTGRLFAPSPLCLEACQREEFPESRRKDYVAASP